jgi:hypothetical protein
MEVSEVYEYIKEWVDAGRTGSIQVNFFMGDIRNINATQCLKEIPTLTKEGKDDERFKD